MKLQAKPPYGYVPMTPSLMDNIGWNELCNMAEQNKKNKEYRDNGEKK